MKNIEMEEFIHKRLGRLSKLSGMISHEVDFDQIHQFRLEFKKLKAFLHLVNVALTGHEKIKINFHLKQLYAYLGMIRNAQIQLLHVGKTLGQLDIMVGVPEYVALLSLDIQNNKNSLIAMKSDQVHFDQWQDEICISLPSRLPTHFIQKFLKKKGNRLEELLIPHYPGDEKMHELRKLLKEIFFDWKWIRHLAMSNFPKGLVKIENIKQFGDLLGQFHDLCIGLNYLQPYYMDQVNDDEEKNRLIIVGHYWNTEKKKMISQIYSQFLGVQLIPAAL